MKTRITFAFGLFATLRLCASLLLFACSVTEGAERPNIILILADDQGWNALSVRADPDNPASASSYFRTPNLAKLAKNGMRFSQAYSPAPTCSPTRHSIQFGRSPASLKIWGADGIRDWDALAGESLANVLRKARPEYTCAHFGKWHIGKSPEALGYEVNDGGNGNGVGNSKDPKDPKLIFGLSRKSTEFMEAQTRADKPFFLQVSHYANHLKYQGLRETVGKYEAEHADKATEYHKDPLWAAMNENLDTGIGIILDKLEELNIADKTYVFYTADNGYESKRDFKNTVSQRGFYKAYPQRSHKYHVSEGGIRVPFIVRGPGIQAGSHSSSPVVGTDLFPTVLSLIGAAEGIPARVEGADLSEHLKSDGQKAIARKDPFLVFKFSKPRPPHDIAIVQQEHKLIKDLDTGESFLFNLKTDIGESKDLSGEKPELARQLNQRMTEYFARFDWDESRIKSHSASKRKKAPKAASSVPEKQPRAPEKAVAYGKKPNVVIIFIDDMGYGDIGPFGSTVNKTPELDRMAKEGLKLTQFYVSNTACTPSRSALMTGTYAHRIGMDGRVVFPGEKRGLNPKEITIAELLKKQGYVTGCFGKWHLGDQPIFLPLAQGFDEYFGIPYSNDMWPGNKRGNPLTNRGPYTPLPVIRQDKAVAYVSDGPDQSLLCEVVTDEAVKFIRKHKNEPFFCYVPHAYVHNPRYARSHILKRARGDVNRSNVEEVDDSVGRILRTLRELGIEKNTLVIFTSDNGGAGGMSMGPLRGGKGGPKYEGHMRVPTLTWWPGTVPAGKVSHEIAATIDLLPSLAKLTGAKVPDDRIIDGKNVLGILMGKPGAKSPHEILYYEIDGIRRGKWKLVSGKRRNLELYDLEQDLSEKTNLATKHPGIVKELKALLDAHAARVASDTRPAAFVEQAKPIISKPGDLPRLREYMALSANRPKTTGKSSKQNKPNVILIMSDDMGYSDLPKFGKSEIPTPNIDRLAKEGTLFTDAYVTAPICVASRMGLLTGQYQQRFGIYGNIYGEEKTRLFLNQTLLPAVFQDAGYRTAHVGKWHLSGNKRMQYETAGPRERGFDESVAIRGGDSPFWKGTPVFRNGKQFPAPEYLTDYWGTEACAFIDRAYDQPFFLYLAYNAVHSPMHALDADLDRFPNVAEENRRIYDGMLLAMDRSIGRVLDRLDKHGIADNTIVVFLNDNGGGGSTDLYAAHSRNYAKNKPLSGHKFDVLEGGVRVPMIIRWPKHAPAGKVYREMVSSTDVYPTLVAAAGLQMPKRQPVDGVNLLPFIKGKNPSKPHEWLCWQNRSWQQRDGKGTVKPTPKVHNSAIRKGNWKLVRLNEKIGSDTPPPAWHLYDLKKDIGERKNVANQNEDVVNELNAHFKTWRSTMHPTLE